MIKCKNIYLRAFEQTDFDKVWKWNNSTSTNYFASSNPYLTASKEQIIKSIITSSQKLFAVCTMDHNLIGQVSYWTPNKFIPSTVEMGTIIGEEDFRNIGYGIEIFLTVCNIIFNEVRVHRVTMCVSEHNFMSKLPLEKSFIIREGVIRKDRFIDGKYYDSIVFGLLRDEYYKYRDDFLELL